MPNGCSPISASPEIFSRTRLNAGELFVWVVIEFGVSEFRSSKGDGDLFNPALKTPHSEQLSSFLRASLLHPENRRRVCSGLRPFCNEQNAEPSPSRRSSRSSR